MKALLPACQQQAADKFGCDLLGGVGEEEWGRWSGSAEKVLVAMGEAWAGSWVGVVGVIRKRRILEI